MPLDGTVYDLETGKVLVWCPKNNPLRFVLGSLKVRQLITSCGEACSVREYIEPGHVAPVPDAQIYVVASGSICKGSHAREIMCVSALPLFVQSTESPKPLKMYPARVNRDGQIFAKFSPS